MMELVATIDNDKPIPSVLRLLPEFIVDNNGNVFLEIERSPGFQYMLSSDRKKLRKGLIKVLIDTGRIQRVDEMVTIKI